MNTTPSLYGTPYEAPQCADMNGIYFSPDGHPRKSPASPFDALRRTHEDGREYWSARDLGEALGYESWQNFEAAIERARASANFTSSNENGYHFTGAGKVIDGGRWGSHRVTDFHLSRYAAYLVAMNGDPRKAEIAAAQTYFAVQTRAAEVQQAPAAPPARMTTRQALMLALEAEDRADAAEAALKAQAPLVAQVQENRLSEGLETIADVAARIQQWELANLAGARVVSHRKVYDLAGELEIIIRTPGLRRNNPTARAIRAQWARAKQTVIERSDGAHTVTTTHLTPRGTARLWDAAIARLKEHGSLTGANN